MLISDGLSVGGVLLASLLAGPAPKLSTFLAGAAIANFTLTPPILHWSNGEYPNGFASLGVRVGFPLVGGALLAASDDSGDTSAILGTVILISWVPASILSDAIWFAHKKPARSSSLVPFLSPQRQGTIAGLGGVF